MALADKKCVPCQPGTPPLAEGRTRQLLAEVPDWRLEGKKIQRTIELADFGEALEFVNRVGDIAETEGHHPDIHIHWNRVVLELWTHTIGGLSENDFIVASKIDALGD